MAQDNIQTVSIHNARVERRSAEIQIKPWQPIEKQPHVWHQFVRLSCISVSAGTVYVIPRSAWCQI